MIISEGGGSHSPDWVQFYVRDGCPEDALALVRYMDKGYSIVRTHFDDNLSGIIHTLYITMRRSRVCRG